MVKKPTLSSLLKSWRLTKLKFSTHVLELEIEFNKSDRNAAWELYIELLTRSATQTIRKEDGDEKSILKSLYSIFDITREILKRNGPSSIEFTKIAIVVLNQIIRPFTSKWHRVLIIDEINNDETLESFREELSHLQSDLTQFMIALSYIAGVEYFSNSTK
jgi:hypothetical protein